VSTDATVGRSLVVAGSNVFQTMSVTKASDTHTSLWEIDVVGRACDGTSAALSLATPTEAASELSYSIVATSDHELWTSSVLASTKGSRFHRLSVTDAGAVTLDASFGVKGVAVLKTARCEPLYAAPVAHALVVGCMLANKLAAAVFKLP
jgi:hypothetical protein